MSAGRWRRSRGRPTGREERGERRCGRCPGWHDGVATVFPRQRWAGHDRPLPGQSSARGRGISAAARGAGHDRSLPGQSSARGRGISAAARGAGHDRSLPGQSSARGWGISAAARGPVMTGPTTTGDNKRLPYCYTVTSLAYTRNTAHREPIPATRIAPAPVYSSVPSAAPA